jgi:hypothetical protein
MTELHTNGAEPSNVDEINQRFLATRREQPFDVVNAQAHAARARFLHEWASLEDPTPAALSWFGKGGPEHYAEHLPRLREWAAQLGS